MDTQTRSAVDSHIASTESTEIASTAPADNPVAAIEAHSSGSNSTIDPSISLNGEKDDQKSDIGSKKRASEESKGLSVVNPIAKKIKLFNSSLDGDDDDDDDSSEDETVANKKDSDGPSKLMSVPEKVEPTEVRRENVLTVQRDGYSIPADSELLKKNDALRSYTSLVQDSSSFHSPSAVYNQLSSIPLNLPAPDYLPPNIQLLINTIPSLDNLATQILRVIVQNPYQKILDLVANPETLAGMTYQTLINLFDNIKNMYSSEDPFLSVEHLTFGLWKEGSLAPTFLRGKEDTVQSTLRKVNLATFLNATLGTIDTGFFYLNESFLDVFCPDQTLNPQHTITNLSSALPQIYDVAALSSHSASQTLGKLLKSQTVLYLELKTQAYISALEAHERSREDILNDIFPENLDQILLRRKTRFNNKDEPQLTPSELDFITRCKKRKENLLLADLDQDLSEQYDWLTFLKDFFEFARKHIGYLVWGSRNVGSESTASNSSRKNPLSSSSRANSGTAVSSGASRTASSAQSSDNQQHPELKYDPNSLPSEIVLQYRENQFSSSNPSLKNLNRRLWTKSEEQALKEALQLKGPQWSQILELYGAGGSISELLKNRSQVQLKDKARNWKIFFLKNGLPLPDYLQKVTGDFNVNKENAAKNKKANAKKGNRPPRIEQKHVDAANAAAVAEAEADGGQKASKVEKPASNEPSKETPGAKPAITDEVNLFAQQSTADSSLIGADKKDPSEPQPETKAETQPETQSQTNPQLGTQLGAQPEPQPEIRAEAQVETEAQAVQADVEAQIEAEVQAQVQAESQTLGQENVTMHLSDHQSDQQASSAVAASAPRDDEVPDYDNILKDLIDQATTDNEDKTTNSNRSTDVADQMTVSHDDQHGASSTVDDDVQRLVDEVINAGNESNNHSSNNANISHDKEVTLKKEQI